MSAHRYLRLARVKCASYRLAYRNDEHITEIALLAGLTPRNSSIFNILHLDPRTTSPTESRVDLCVGTDRPVEARDERVVSGVIPGGRCAVLRIVGHIGDLKPAALFLYRDWLPASGEEVRDFRFIASASPVFPTGRSTRP